APAPYRYTDGNSGAATDDEFNGDRDAITNGHCDCDCDCNSDCDPDGSSIADDDSDGNCSSRGHSRPSSDGGPDSTAERSGDLCKKSEAGDRSASSVAGENSGQR